MFEVAMLFVLFGLVVWTMAATPDGSAQKLATAAEKHRRKKLFP